VAAGATAAATPTSVRLSRRSFAGFAGRSRRASTRSAIWTGAAATTGDNELDRFTAYAGGATPSAGSGAAAFAGGTAAEIDGKFFARGHRERRGDLGARPRSAGEPARSRTGGADRGHLDLGHARGHFEGLFGAGAGRERVHRFRKGARAEAKRPRGRRH
jgi:hypothetical protein